jgi:hypothetical protein
MRTKLLCGNIPLPRIPRYSSLTNVHISPQLFGLDPTPRDRQTSDFEGLMKGSARR